MVLNFEKIPHICLFLHISMTYNGWTNRETWLVNLWYNPEYKRTIDYLEETLQDEFNDMLEAQFGTSSHIYADMIDFHAINWDELREHLSDEEE